MKLKKLIFILDLLYWFFYLLNWIFKGLAELANAAGEFARVVRNRDDSDD